jgi:cytidylate kinase
MSLKEKAYDFKNRFVIALDGPSGSGKGLIGSMLAKLFELKYVQSSLVYRGLAFICIQENVPEDDTHSVIKLSKMPNILARISDVDLGREDIAAIASKISQIPEVRVNLGKYLVKLINENQRIIMEGRDIGTVIAPNADLKIFLTADVKVRASRRYKQLISEGKECILQDVLDQMIKRDERDSTRAAAPLVPAADSCVIDASDLTPDQVVQKIKNIVS